MFSGMEGRIKATVSATRSDRFTASTRNLPLPEYASICRVRWAACSPALTIPSNNPAAALSGGRISRARLALPRMFISRLLKSWATPAASTPTLSRFRLLRRRSSPGSISAMHSTGMCIVRPSALSRLASANAPAA